MNEMWSGRTPFKPLALAAVSIAAWTMIPPQTAVAEDSGNQSSNAAAAGTSLTEIIVSAQKRSERLQDVPVPVSVIDAGSLLETNQLRVQDYYASVPGLNLTTDIRGDANISIRGVTTGGQNGNPLVGVIVDDVPYGSSSGYGGLVGQVPDLDPSDLASVEVLRGPQGTLYGASSMGGLLKFVTVDPSMSGYSGRVEAGANTVSNGTQTGYNFRGAINVPLSETFAVRASAFTRQAPGYLDNVQTGQRGVNEVQVDGARLSSLWKPSQEFSLKFSALFQDSRAYGSPIVNVGPGFADLQQSTLRGTGGNDEKFQVYNGTLTAKLGAMDLIAITGYSVNTISDDQDITFAFGGLTQTQFGVGGTPLTDKAKTKKFTEEIRLSAPLGQYVEWRAGVFYTHEASRANQQVLAADAATGAAVGLWLDDTWPTTYQEYAVFTDWTVHFTDRFDVQFGGREGQNRQTYSETLVGPYDPVLVGLPSPVVQPELDSKDNAFTYLVTPRFKVSPDLMVYSRLASGYRAGGPNPTSDVYGLPASFKPDKTQSYEIGAKGEFFNHALSVDASLYYINWKDIQLQLLNPVSSQAYYVNASSAKSQGIELSVRSRPLEGFTIAAWLAWNDAELTKQVPAASSTYGSAGDRLPFSSRYSGNLSLEQEFHLLSDVTGFVGGSVSYVGDRQGNFASIFAGSPERQLFPAYTKTDLHAGMDYKSWKASLFVTNLANKRGVLAGGIGFFNPGAFEYIEPRTVGLTVSKTF
jgi:outer membrane receptor protein involved in Fe transport